jgi:hypothetical protein
MRTGPSTLGSAGKIQGTCSISVTWSPTGAGPESGNLMIMDDASNSPQMVRLSGKGKNGNKR